MAPATATASPTSAHDSALASTRPPGVVSELAGSVDAVVRLRESRARALEARAASEHLCARAGAGIALARELRVLGVEQAYRWRGWHRLWRRVVRGTPGREHGRRAIVRTCMYCRRIYLALPLARGIDEHERGWHTAPTWVQERLLHPTIGIVVSHGMCAGCAPQHDAD